MNVDKFSQQIEALRSRVATLLQCTDSSPLSPQQLLSAAFEEIQIALEQLKVAEDELRQQNQQLCQQNADIVSAQAAAEEQRQRYQELFELAPDGYIVTSTDGTIREANHAAAMLFNVPQKVLIGKPLVVFVAESQRHSFHSELTRLCQVESLIAGNRRSELSQTVEGYRGNWRSELSQTVERVKDWELCLSWREHQLIDAVATVAIVRNQEGKPNALRWVLRDITDKKKLERQLLRSQQIHSFGTLALRIAFDLNNLLTPILMSAQLLQRNIPDERRQSLLKIIEVNAKSSAAVVKQMRLFARNIEQQRTIVQVRHLLLAIQHIVTETFPKSIELYINVEPDLWLVPGDAIQLHQMLMNLVMNARDAMPNGGTLKICAENFFIDQNYARKHLHASVGPYVAITVADTGIGIPPEILDRIFEPFFTIKELGRGMGIGLSTVSSIIKSHVGFINVSSQVGSTQFQVFLPAVEQTAIERMKDLELPTGQGELILVVDKEAAIQEIAKTSLETYNYKVITASDSTEAIALYDQHQDEISLVLMDMTMPNMGVITTIRSLQKMNPFVRIVAVSEPSTNAQLGQVPGVKTFLSKPYTTKDLLQAIRYCYP